MSRLVLIQDALQDWPDLAVTRAADLHSFGRSQQHRYLVDPDSGRKVALSRTLLGLADAKGALFVLIETGVWPSSEMPSLFESLRREHGQIDPLTDLEGEWIEVSEREYFEALVFCCLSFAWSFALIWPKEKIVIYHDHDEWLVAHSPDSALKGHVHSFLKNFGLRRR